MSALPWLAEKTGKQYIGAHTNAAYSIADRLAAVWTHTALSLRIQARLRPTA